VNLRDAVGLTDSSLWYVVRVMQLGLVGTVLYGLLTVDLALTVNGFLSLLVTLTPEFVKWRYGHTMDASLGLWIGTAAFLHSIGALGPYKNVPGYDIITHTLTATLVAGLAYAIVQALDQSSDAVEFPPSFRFLFIVIFVLAFGVIWEIAEFAAGGVGTLIGGQEVLTQYGMRDTVLDLVFDGLGSVVVALWGTGYFDGVASMFSRSIDTVFGRTRE
jgi:flagellar biosynthesis protein FliQ